MVAQAGCTDCGSGFAEQRLGYRHTHLLNSGPLFSLVEPSRLIHLLLCPSHFSAALPSTTTVTYFVTTHVLYP